MNSNKNKNIKALGFAVILLCGAWFSFCYCNAITEAKAVKEKVEDTRFKTLELYEKIALSQKEATFINVLRSIPILKNDLPKVVEAPEFGELGIEDIPWYRQKAQQKEMFAKYVQIREQYLGFAMFWNSYLEYSAVLFHANKVSIDVPEGCLFMEVKRESSSYIIPCRKSQIPLHQPTIPFHLILLVVGLGVLDWFTINYSTKPVEDIEKVPRHNKDETYIEGKQRSTEVAHTDDTSLGFEHQQFGENEIKGLDYFSPDDTSLVFKCQDKSTSTETIEEEFEESKAYKIFLQRLYQGIFNEKEEEKKLIIESALQDKREANRINDNLQDQLSDNKEQRRQEKMQHQQTLTEKGNLEERLRLKEQDESRSQKDLKEAKEEIILLKEDIQETQKRNDHLNDQLAAQKVQFFKQIKTNQEQQQSENDKREEKWNIEENERLDEILRLKSELKMEKFSNETLKTKLASAEESLEETSNYYEGTLKKANHNNRLKRHKYEMEEETRKEEEKGKKPSNRKESGWLFLDDGDIFGDQE